MSSPFDRLVLASDEVCADCMGIIWGGEAAVMFEPHRYRHYPQCPAPGQMAPPEPKEEPMPVSALGSDQSTSVQLLALLRDRAVNRTTQSGGKPKRRGGYANMTVGEIADTLGTDAHEVVHVLHGLQKQGMVQFKEGRGTKVPVGIRVTGGIEPAAVQSLPAVRLGVTDVHLNFPRTGADISNLPTKAPGGVITRRVETPSPDVAAAARAARLGELNPTQTLQSTVPPLPPTAFPPGSPYAGESAASLGIPSLGTEYPLIAQLVTSDSKVRDAVRLLREAGRDTAADLVEGDVREHTPLESEVLALVELLMRVGMLA